MIRLCNQLNNTTSLGDLALCLLADPSCADDQWNLWDATLAENFAVAEGEEIKNWDGVGLLARDVLGALLSWDERPELVQVDDWLPEVVALLVEVTHTNLTKVTWMVLIQVGTVMVLTTSKTTTTWMLAVLSYTSVTGGDVTTAVREKTDVSLRAPPIVKMLFAITWQYLKQIAMCIYQCASRAPPPDHMSYVCMYGYRSINECSLRGGCDVVLGFFLFLLAEALLTNRYAR